MLDAESRGLHFASMRFSMQAQYAICAVFDLAYNGEKSAVQVREVSVRQGIPLRYLEQLFRRLRQANLVTSKRGPGGGYTLVRVPEKISIREIVEAIEGPLSEMAARLPELTDGAPVHRPDFFWQDLAQRFATTLDQISLAHLCREAARHNIPRAHPDTELSLMYHI